MTDRDLLDLHLRLRKQAFVAVAPALTAVVRDEAPAPKLASATDAAYARALALHRSTP